MVLLALAASKKTGVPVAQLKTAHGAVQLPDGKQLKYTELAELAATLEPVSAVTLREPSEWRLIGKPVQIFLKGEQVVIEPLP